MYIPVARGMLRSFYLKKIVSHSILQFFKTELTFSNISSLQIWDFAYYFLFPKWFLFFPLPQMLLATVVFILAAKIKAEEQGVFFKIEENSFLFYENSIWIGKADSLMSCSQMCTRRAACKSANFIASQGTCSLLTDIQTKQSKRLLKQDGSFYLEKVCYQLISCQISICRPLHLT